MKLLQDKLFRVTSLVVLLLSILLPSNPRVLNAALVRDFLSFGGTGTDVITTTANFGISNAMTLEAWVRSSNFNQDVSIVSKTENSNFLFKLEGGNLISHIKTTTTSGYATLTTPISNLKINQWNHIALTYDGAKNTLYVNGVQMATAALTGTVVNSSIVPFVIGAEPKVNADQTAFSGTFENFVGDISEVRIWNRGLSLTELQTNADKVLSGTESGLTGMWRFDPYTTRLVYDLSPNNYNGTVRGISSKPTDLDTFNGSTGVDINISSNGKTNRIFKNNTQLTSTTSSRYTDTSVTAGTDYTYSYEVVTPNGESNRSNNSNITRGIPPAQSVSLNGTSQYFKGLSLPVDINAGAINTVEYWMKWAGGDSALRYMVFAWGNTYNISLTADGIGFNTGNGDLLGAPFPSAIYANKWVHITAVFNNGDVNASTVKLYINGQIQTLTNMKTNPTVPNTINRNIRISGWEPNADYQFNGDLGELTVWDHERSATQIKQDMARTTSGMVGKWGFDNVGTAKVYDKSGNNISLVGYGYTYVPPITLKSNSSGANLTFTNSGFTNRIYRNNVVLTDTTQNSYLDNNLLNGQFAEYRYEIITPNGESLSSLSKSTYHVNGLPFNGTTNKFKMSSQLNLGTGDFTIEIMAKIDAQKAETTFTELLAKRILPSGKIFEIQVCAPGWIEVYIGDQTSSTGPYFLRTDTNVGIVNYGSYHHYALVRQGTSLTLYLDGKQVAQRGIPSDLTFDNSSEWFVGSDVDGTTKNESMQGNVKEVRFWNKAKTASEISTDRVLNLTGNETGLIGLWKWDEITSGLVFDQSSQNNHAIGYNYTTPLNLNASNIDDIGMDLSWNKVTGASTYELNRDSTVAYDGPNSSFSDVLVSDTTYSYTVQAKTVNGKSVAATDSYKTNVGELSLISIPSQLNAAFTLNGISPKAYGTFNNKIIVKDTRKVRNGWRLVANSTTLQRTDGLKSFPKDSVKIKPIITVSQTRGSIQALPKKFSTQVQAIDTRIPLEQAKVAIIKPTPASNITSWSDWFFNSVPNTTLLDINTMDVTTAKAYDLIVYDQQYWGIEPAVIDKLKSFVDAGVSVMATGNDTGQNISILDNDIIPSSVGTIDTGTYDVQFGIQTLQNGAKPLYRRTDYNLNKFSWEER